MRPVPPTPAVILPSDRDVMPLKTPWRGGWFSPHLVRFRQSSERRKMELKENGFQLHSWRRPWGPSSKAGPAAAPAVGSPALLLPHLMAADLGAPGSGASACGSTRLPSLHPSRKRNQKMTMTRSMGFALGLPGSKPSPTGQGRFFQDKSLNHFPVSSSMRWG